MRRKKVFYTTGKNRMMKRVIFLTYQKAIGMKLL